MQMFSVGFCTLIKSGFDFRKMEQQLSRYAFEETKTNEKRTIIIFITFQAFHHLCQYAWIWMILVSSNVEIPSFSLKKKNGIYKRFIPSGLTELIVVKIILGIWCNNHATSMCSTWVLLVCSFVRLRGGLSDLRVSQQFRIDYWLDDTHVFVLNCTNLIQRITSIKLLDCRLHHR